MTEPITLTPDMREGISRIQSLFYRTLYRKWLSVEIENLRQASLTYGQGRASDDSEEALRAELFVFLEEDTERNNLLKRYYYKAQLYREHDVHRYTAAIRLILAALDPQDPSNALDALEVIKIHLGDNLKDTPQLPLPLIREVSVSTSFPAHTVSASQAVQDEAFRILKEKISELVHIEEISLQDYGSGEGYHDTQLHLRYTTKADIQDNTEVDIYDITDHVYPVFEQYPTIFILTSYMRSWWESTDITKVGRESQNFNKL